jgi:hypothetical protein
MALMLKTIVQLCEAFSASHNFSMLSAAAAAAAAA